MSLHHDSGISMHFVSLMNKALCWLLTLTAVDLKGRKQNYNDI